MSKILSSAPYNLFIINDLLSRTFAVYLECTWDRTCTAKFASPRSADTHGSCDFAAARKDADAIAIVTMPHRVRWLSTASDYIPKALNLTSCEAAADPCGAGRPQGGSVSFAPRSRRTNEAGEKYIAEGQARNLTRNPTRK